MHDLHSAAEPPGKKSPLRNLLNAALVLGALSAMVTAVGLVIVLFSWVQSLPEREESHRSANPPQKQGLPVVSRPAPAEHPPDGAAAPIDDAPVPVAAASPQSPTPPAQAVPARKKPFSETEMNRSLGQSLSRLGEDPESQRAFDRGGAAPPR